MSLPEKRQAFLPYGRQLIDDDDVAAVAEVLRGDWLTTGPAVEAFEADFAEIVEAPHAASCSSGTAALHLAALALGLAPGDLVVVPALTFLATANAVRLAGAEVVFCDVDADTGLMSRKHLEDAFSRVAANERKSVKAVFPVHLNGQVCDMPDLAEAARAAGLAVVEDACHAAGATYRDENGDWLPAGGARHADLVVFSFHPVKAIAAGEGGMVTTRDGALDSAIRRFRNHGIVREAGAFRQSDLAFSADGSVNPWYYEMHAPGLNYRLSDIHAALGTSQLKKLTGRIAERRRLAECYAECLRPLAPEIRTVASPDNCRSAWHLLAVLIDFEKLGADRAAMMKALRAREIGSQVHYIPVHLQPYYRDRYGSISLPGAENYYSKVLSLPLYPGLTERDVERVVSELAAAAGLAERLG